MTALAPVRQLARPALPGRVPVEWIGRARALRGRLAAADGAVQAACEALLAPFRPRPGFTPMPRHAHLVTLRRRWRALPAFGRMRLLSKFDEGRLLIVEMRVEPGRLSLPGWDGDELALSIILRTLAIRPPAFSQQMMPLAFVGLHALARRYERGAARDDLAVLRDLAPLGRGWGEAIQGDDFAIEAPAGGRWVGAVMQAGGMPVLAVRTFIG